MADDDLEIVHSSSNIFRDFGAPDADREHLRSVLAARIIIALEESGLTVRQAAEMTGIAAADFSRIRRVKLSRFTIDRLITILNRLGRRVDFEVTVVPEAKIRQRPAA